MTIFGRLVLGATFLSGLAAVAWSSDAQAFKATQCTAGYSKWNAPKGAIAVTTSDGPIRSVLQGVNEYFTHSIVSNGGDWATHSTSLTPSSQDDCSNPIKPGELRDGYPGFSQARIGGIYNYARGADSDDYVHPKNFPKVQLHPWVQGGNELLANRTADWLLTAPRQWVPKVTQSIPGLDVTGGFFKLGYTENGAFKHMPYNFHQYQAGAIRSYGYEPAVAWNDRGIVCSQVAPYGLAKSGNDDIYIAPYKYPNYPVAVAGSNLWHTVNDECGEGFGYWTTVGAYIFTGCSDLTICKNAAWQVLNCFFKGGNCDDTSRAAWDQFVANSATDPWGVGAESISPDFLIGWGPGRNNYPVTGANVSPWAAYDIYALQFSGPDVYECYW